MSIMDTVGGVMSIMDTVLVGSMEGHVTLLVGSCHIMHEYKLMDIRFETQYLQVYGD